MIHTKLEEYPVKYFSFVSIIFVAIFVNLLLNGCAHKHPGEYQMSTNADQNKQEQFEDGDDYLIYDEEIEEDLIHVSDPLFYWNKAMYHFTDKFILWLLEPAAKGYKWAVPSFVRTGVKNFFYNVGFPGRFVSCLLQGKGAAATGEVGRFFLNTTVGILGFGNPAQKYPALNPAEEDVGQAFGSWGVGNGIYVFWPILGPSTLRDSVGLVGDYFLDPSTYVDPSKYSKGIKAYDSLNEASLKIGDYESLKKAALDPYVAIRDGYIQSRNKKINE